MQNYYRVPLITKDNYLIHYGTKGQKWGVRRYQNADGSYTQAGKERYYKNKDKKRKAIGTVGALSGAIIGGVAPTAVSLAIDKLTKSENNGLSLMESLLFGTGSAAVGSALGRIGAQKIYDVSNQKRR